MNLDNQGTQSSIHMHELALNRGEWTRNVSEILRSVAEEAHPKIIHNKQSIKSFTLYVSEY
jgi:hypothetical protein